MKNNVKFNNKKIAICCFAIFLLLKKIKKSIVQTQRNFFRSIYFIIFLTKDNHPIKIKNDNNCTNKKMSLRKLIIFQNIQLKCCRKTTCQNKIDVHA